MSQDNKNSKDLSKSPKKSGDKLEVVNKIKETRVGEKGTNKKAIYGHLIFLGVGLIFGAVLGTTMYITMGNKGNTDNTVMTAKKTKVTYKDLVPLLNTSSQTQSLTQQYLAGKAFENNHGDLVSDKQIDEAVNKVKNQYGTNYDKALKQSGYTPSSFREFTRQSLIMKAFVEKNIKVNDNDLKDSFSKYIPDQDVTVAVFDQRNDAQGYQKDPSNKKYAKHAQEMVIGTNNNPRGLSNDILQTAYETKQGKTSKIISQSSQSGNLYVVIKVNKHADKGKDWTKYKSELEKQAKNSKLGDVNYSSKAVQSELKRLDFDIKDSTIKDMVTKAFSDTGVSKEAE